MFLPFSLCILVACGGQTAQQPGTRTGNKSSGEELGKSSKSGGDNKKCFSVVNGEETSSYPGVVLILMFKGNSVTSTCTGFFVGPNTMLTASHCVDPTKFDSFLVSSVTRLNRGSSLPSGFKPSKVIAPRIVSSALIASERAYDVAAMVFSSDVAPAIVNLVKESPSAGDKVTVVGYGQTNVDNGGVAEGALVKRYGSNEVGQASNGIISFVGPMFNEGLDPEARESGGAPGDSGGPLFLGDKVAGIVSGASGQPTQDTVTNVYADVTHAHTKDILRRAAEAGGKISSSPDTEAEEELGEGDSLADDAEESGSDGDADSDDSCL